MSAFWKVISHKKQLDSIQTEQTQLARILNTFDLTALGVGSTLGVGVYVLAGQVARNTAGPSVILSFLIAAVASVFAGLCYAEFGARTPRAGSAYIYSYVTVGELVAFVIGWNLILEYVIGSASVARGMSSYLDALLNHTLKNTFREIAPINVDFMSSYFDFFAFGLSILLAVALSFGLKESSMVNNVITLLNIAVVLFVIIAGSIKANTENWSLPPQTVNSTTDQGGFFPFRIEGMIKGAATCFYGFVGFDCIATTGEEVKNPQKAIPLAIILSLTVIFLSYFGTSTVLTLMIPYYLMDENAPIPHAFESVGWNVAKWIVTIGGMFGLCASLFGAMFPLPRIIYAMASDGIIFKFLGRVNQRFKTPVIGTLLAGVLTGLMGALFELKHLVNMMSIGTLLAYTLVAACVLILRYQRDKESLQSAPPLEGYRENQISQDNSDYLSSQNDSIVVYQKVSFGGITKQIFNIHGLKFPTKTSELLVVIEIFLFCIFALLLSLSAVYLIDPITHGKIWAIVIVSALGLIMLLLLLSLTLQPVSYKQLRFKVPLVPLIPLLSITINIYLMVMLDGVTWIRFAVWMAIGVPMYFICVFGSSNDVNQFSIKNSNSLMHVEKKNAYNNNSNKTNGHLNYGFVEISKDENSNNHNGITGLYQEQVEGKTVFSVTNEEKLKEIQNNDEIGLKKKIKPKAPVPPPLSILINDNFKESDVFLKTESATNVDSQSVNNVLAMLDEVISKEENNQATFEVNEEKTEMLTRNSSYDSSSLFNGTREEHVIAMIHQEDEKSLKEAAIVQNGINKIISEKIEKVPTVEPPNETHRKISEDVPINLTKNENHSFKEDLKNNEQETELHHITDIRNNAFRTSENSLKNTDDVKIIDTEEFSMELKNSTLSNSVPENLHESLQNNSKINNDVIPPAPPFKLYLEYDFKTVPRIPRITSKNETFSSMKNLRNSFSENENAHNSELDFSKKIIEKQKEKVDQNNTITIPPVDYENESDFSSESSNVILDDKNVTFGSEEHKNITSKLERLLSQSMGTPPPKKLTKSEVPLDNYMSPTSPFTSLEYEDNSIYEETPNIRRNTDSLGENVDIKTKLNEILRKSLRPNPSTFPTEKDKSLPKINVVLDIKPQNERSKESNNENGVNDQERNSHREKMNDAFKSIRLRKVDSFKNNN